MRTYVELYVGMYVDTYVGLYVEIYVEICVRIIYEPLREFGFARLACLASTRPWVAATRMVVRDSLNHRPGPNET